MTLSISILAHFFMVIIFVEAGVSAKITKFPAIQYVLYGSITHHAVRVNCAEGLCYSILNDFCNTVYTTHLVTPAFSATAIAASSAAVSTSGLRGRKEDVKKLNMSRGERTLEEKITKIESISPPKSFSP